MVEGSELKSKIKKFVADGVFHAELNEFFSRVLAEEGYAGVEVRHTPTRTEIIISATRTKEVLGEKGRRIKKLTALVQTRFGFQDGVVELLADRVQNRGLCSMAQAESLRYKLLKGLPVRRAAMGVMKSIKDAGADGCEIIVSGKLRGQRAKSMKFKDGYLLSSGQPAIDFVDKATRCVLMKQGMLGIKVKIQLKPDPEALKGPTKPLPDHVIILEPKVEVIDINKEVS